MARGTSIDDMLDSTPAAAEVAAASSPATAPATPVATPHPAATPAVATGQTAIDRRPVRTTVDLRADEYEAFVDWCAATAKAVGRPRVHGQQVMRVLVRRLMADPALAKKVTSDIKKHAGQLNNEY